MTKKHKHPEHQNMEAWIISYADMVTLLFALFVVLYAIGQTELGKLQKLKKSMTFAMHYSGLGGTDKPGLHKGEEHKKGEVFKAAPLLNAQRILVLRLSVSKATAGKA